jgi:hypothetical protein
VSAILVSKFSPFDLICGGKLFQVANPILLDDLEEDSDSSTPRYSRAIINKMSQRFSILCTPLFFQSASNIDSIYAQTMSIVRRAESLLGSGATLEQLSHLKSDAEKLREAYNVWPNIIPQEWMPRSVGLITSRNDKVM